MQTSLQGIANRAAKDKAYRFRNLFGMLTIEFLIFCWRYVNKKAAPGVDCLDAKEYGQNLIENVKELVAKLIGKCYRAKLVLRKYVPKLNGKLRPLGLPVISDKLLQTAVARILGAIYEQDFLSFSYGYRPGRGAHDALRELSAELYKGIYPYIVEADIKGFFDNINHEILIGLLARRIDDRSFLGLIMKWLKAGILDTTGMIIDPATGTPQGGVVSPILANVYLHYALDIWFETVVKAHCRGKVYLCRYADDFVVLFQYGSDAKWFYGELGGRLREYGLELAAEKTQIIKFSRYEKDPKPGFEFLGFEFQWGLDRKGRPVIKRRSARKKYRAAIANFKKWCRKKRSFRLKELFSELKSKLRGYFNYYGLRNNSESLSAYNYQITKILFKWVNRRSQHKSYNWEGFNELLKWFKVPRPRISANF